MSFHVDAIRAEIERVDAIRSAFRAIRTDVDLVEDLLLRSKLHESISLCEAVVLNKSMEETFMPDAKLMVCGSSQIGKTALIRQFLHRDFNSDPNDSKNIELRKQKDGRVETTVTIGNQPRKLAVICTDSQPSPQAISWADSILVLYSVKDIDSFNEVFPIYHRVMHYSNELANVFLVACQADDSMDSLDDDNHSRVIPMIEGKRLAYDLKDSLYFEVSAKTGYHVDSVFEEAIRATNSSSRSPDIRKRGRKQSSAKRTLDHLTRNLKPHRTLPYRQGYLFKQTEKSMVKEFRKKYCVLGKGVLFYYNSMNEYRIDENKRSIELKTCTVKRPREQSISSVKRVEDVPANEVEVSCEEMDTENDEETTTASMPMLAPKTKLVSNLSSPIPSPRSSASSFTFSEQPLSTSPCAANSQTPTNAGHDLALQNAMDRRSSSSTSVHKPSQKPRSGSHNSQDYNRSSLSNLSSSPQAIDFVGGRGENGNTSPKPRTPSASSLSSSHTTSVGGGGEKGHLSFSDFKNRRSNSVDSTHNASAHELEQIKSIEPSMSFLPKNKKDKISKAEKRESQKRISKAKSIEDKKKKSTFGRRKKESTPAPVEPEAIVVQPVVEQPIAVVRETVNSNDPQLIFHLIALDGREWHFVATTAEECKEWVQALQEQIMEGLTGNHTDKYSKSGFETSQGNSIDSLRKVSGNAMCAECNNPAPEWASINLGILICVECSGIHRGLGVQFSRVRSLTLDDWNPVLIKVMKDVGNRKSKLVWEEQLEKKGGERAVSDSARNLKETFIRKKYIDKTWLSLPEDVDPSHLGEELMKLTLARNFDMIYTILPFCSQADFNYKDGDQNTSLHIAASHGDTSIAQLLIWSGITVDEPNSQGQTPLEIAETSDHKLMVDLLSSSDHQINDLRVGRHKTG